MKFAAMITGWALETLVVISGSFPVAARLSVAVGVTWRGEGLKRLARRRAILQCLRAHVDIEDSDRIFDFIPVELRVGFGSEEELFANRLVTSIGNEIRLDQSRERGREV